MEKKVLEPFGEVIQQQHYLQQQQPVVVLQQLQLQLPQQPHPHVQGPPYQGPRMLQIHNGFNPPRTVYGQPRYVGEHRPPMNQHGLQWHVPTTKSLQCEKCERTFKKMKDKMKHQSKQGMVLICPVCFKRFCNNNDLEVHDLQVHKAKVESVTTVPAPKPQVEDLIRNLTQGPYGGPQSVIQGPGPNIILPKHPLPISPVQNLDPKTPKPQNPENFFRSLFILI